MTSDLLVKKKLSLKREIPDFPSAVHLRFNLVSPLYVMKNHMSM